MLDWQTGEVNAKVSPNDPPLAFSATLLTARSPAQYWVTNLLATTVGDSGEKSIKNSKITENYRRSEVATGQDRGSVVKDLPGTGEIVAMGKALLGM